MSKKDIVKAIQGAGLPIAHFAFPVGSAPELPWCVYYLEEDNKLSADNARFASYPRYTVELYQAASDTDTEAKVEAAITATFGDYDKSEAWVESESCVMTTYTFSDFERI